MSLGIRLRKLRISQELTQKQLGDRIGVAESTVSLYESNKRTPDSDTINKIADCFNVSTDYLLGRSNVRRPGDVAALSSDVPYDDLPPEAIKELQQYREFLIQKYGKRK